MIIDFNVYAGNCPGGFGDHGYADLKKGMDDAGIDLAVVSYIGSTFEYACADPGDDRFALFVGLMPDVEVEKIPKSARGICLYPGYDTWDFEGEKWAEIMGRARYEKWIVHLSAQFLDSRVLDQKNPIEEQLPLFNSVAEKWSDVRFVISGARVFDVEANKELFAKSNVWTDISHVQHPLNSLPRLLKAVDASKVLFASNAPFFYPYTNVFRVNNSPISDEAKRKIFEGNARGLLGI